MKPIRSVAAFAIAGLVVAFGVTAAAAPAAAAAGLHASASSAAGPSHVRTPSPASGPPCDYHSNRFVTYTYFCGDWINWKCEQGKTANLSPTPDAVSNACALDVELYSGFNQTGTTLCIARDSRTGQFNKSWQSFRMVTGNC
jgi:hypothetical protein